MSKRRQSTADLEAQIMQMPGVHMLRVDTSRLTIGIAKTMQIVESIEEKDFQAAVKNLATDYGWKHFHPYSSRKSEEGYPDSTMVRGGRVIFAELKTETGKASAEQLVWGELLAAVGGNVEYYLWRPSDWPEIERVLR